MVLSRSGLCLGYFVHRMGISICALFGITCSNLYCACKVHARIRFWKCVCICIYVVRDSLYQVQCIDVIVVLGYLNVMHSYGFMYVMYIYI